MMLVILLIVALQAQNNTIRGKVRAPDGSTLNNAIVELRQGGGGIISQTVTRNDGDFAFSGLISSEYEIFVNLAGYEPATQRVRFNHSPRDNFQEVLYVEVTLRPKVEPALAPPGVRFVQDVPGPAREAFQKGLARLREGRSEEGIALLKKAITLFTDYFDAHFELAAEFYRMGRYQEAIESLERARQINDRQGGVYYLFGLIMVKQRKFAVAEYAFRQAIKLSPGNAPSHFYRGLALIELAARAADQKQRDEDLAEAAASVDRAWDLSRGKLSTVYLLRARICEQRGQREAAARQLENYLKAEPDAKEADAIRQAISKLRGQS
jgi:tetratricopeptide (TPR) repeat protein